MMPDVRPALSFDERLLDDLTMNDPPPEASGLNEHKPEWLWVCVRERTNPLEQVWVRFAAESAPEGRPTRRAHVPTPGSLGVVVLHAPGAIVPERAPEARAKRRYKPRAPRPAPTDRNIITVDEFAAAMAVSRATIWQWIKVGLPSMKMGGVRRVLKKEAEAWLLAGGLRTSRVAKKLAKAAYRTKKAGASGGTNGAG